MVSLLTRRRLKVTPERGLTRHYFTFGTNHMTNFPLPHGGRLADYWVTVEAEEDHRKIFMDQFTEHYCPRRVQFSMEYDDDDFNREYFPNGELCVVRSTGIVR